MKAMTDSAFELEAILRSHAQRYPLMQPQDAVKLIYQNEFGGGHLIRDTESCKAYLRREYDAVAKDPQLPLYEEIGNGIVRVNLAAMEENQLEELAQSFIRSAAKHTGSMEVFQQKLDVLHRLTAQGLLPFPLAALEDYLAQYRAVGCPMVSHTQVYRNAYQPAYRVVLKRYLRT